jgi:hypothetical protein
MNNKKAKKMRRGYKQIINRLANGDIKDVIFTITRQRDWMFILNIVQFIIIVVLIFILL